MYSTEQEKEGVTPENNNNPGNWCNLKQLLLKQRRRVTDNRAKNKNGGVKKNADKKKR